MCQFLKCAVLFVGPAMVAVSWHDAIALTCRSDLCRRSFEQRAVALYLVDYSGGAICCMSISYYTGHNIIVAVMYLFHRLCNCRTSRLYTRRLCAQESSKIDIKLAVALLLSLHTAHNELSVHKNYNYRLSMRSRADAVYKWSTY